MRCLVTKMYSVKKLKVCEKLLHLFRDTVYKNNVKDLAEKMRASGACTVCKVHDASANRLQRLPTRYKISECGSNVCAFSVRLNIKLC